MPPASAAKPTVMRIALTSNTTNDRRELDIHAGSAVTLGRASRSKGKHLEAQSNNALFDCPVVSRIHAEFRATPLKPYDEQVTISDLTSLHGTKVNGQSLDPGSSFALRTGDVIKLGERVTRGDGMLPLDCCKHQQSANNIPDAHEGVTLIFERLTTHTPSSYMSSTADLIPQATRRGFRAPSDSDASDLDSENMDPYVSDGEDHHSSAKTTPEQNKIKLGTQDAPFILDDILDGDAADSDEDITFSRRAPESNLRPALSSAQQTDFESFSDVDSNNGNEYILLADDGVSGGESDDNSEIDHADEVEYGEDEDDEDNLSNPPSELSSEEESEYDDEEPSWRQPSPELGSFDDTQDASIGQPIAYTDLLSMEQSAWRAPTSPKPRYDPVRSSMPAAAEQTAEPAHTGRTLTTPFTYGYPGYDVLPATNFPPSSHWDVQHPIFPNAFVAPNNAANESQYGLQPANPQPLFPMTIDAIVEPPLKAADETPAKVMMETVDKPAGEPSSKEPVVESATDGNSKRKRDHEDDAVDILEPPTKKSAQAAPAPPVRRRSSPKKHHSAIRKAVMGATQAAAFAAVGAVGTVAFLSSPMAESLIQWLG